MSNIVEFAIKMKDVMSGGLSRLSSTSQSTFARMGRHINDVTGRNKTLSMSFSEIEKKIRDAENVIRNSTIPSQIREARRSLPLCSACLQDTPEIQGVAQLQKKEV